MRRPAVYLGHDPADGLPKYYTWGEVRNACQSSISALSPGRLFTFETCAPTGHVRGFQELPPEDQTGQRKLDGVLTIKDVVSRLGHDIWGLQLGPVFLTEACKTLTIADYESWMGVFQWSWASKRFQLLTSTRIVQEDTGHFREIRQCKTKFIKRTASAKKSDVTVGKEAVIADDGSDGEDEETARPTGRLVEGAVLQKKDNHFVVWVVGFGLCKSDVRAGSEVPRQKLMSGDFVQGYLRDDLPDSFLDNWTLIAPPPDLSWRVIRSGRGDISVQCQLTTRTRDLHIGKAVFRYSSDFADVYDIHNRISATQQLPVNVLMGWLEERSRFYVKEMVTPKPLVEGQKATHDLEEVEIEELPLVDINQNGEEDANEVVDTNINAYVVLIYPNDHYGLYSISKPGGILLHAPTKAGGRMKLGTRVIVDCVNRDAKVHRDAFNSVDYDFYPNCATKLMKPGKKLQNCNLHGDRTKGDGAGVRTGRLMLIADLRYDVNTGVYTHSDANSDKPKLRVKDSMKLVQTPRYDCIYTCKIYCDYKATKLRDDFFSTGPEWTILELRKSTAPNANLPAAPIITDLAPLDVLHSRESIQKAPFSSVVVRGCVVQKPVVVSHRLCSAPATVPPAPTPVAKNVAPAIGAEIAPTDNAKVPRSSDDRLPEIPNSHHRDGWYYGFAYIDSYKPNPETKTPKRSLKVRTMFGEVYQAICDSDQWNAVRGRWVEFQLKEFEHGRKGDNIRTLSEAKQRLFPTLSVPKSGVGLTMQLPGVYTGSDGGKPTFRTNFSGAELIRGSEAQQTIYTQDSIYTLNLIFVVQSRRFELVTSSYVRKVVEEDEGDVRWGDGAYSVSGDSETDGDSDIDDASRVENVMKASDAASDESDADPDDLKHIEAYLKAAKSVDQKTSVVDASVLDGLAEAFHVFVNDPVLYEEIELLLKGNPLLVAIRRMKKLVPIN
ncbi:unnamed protein product, partial [Mesorhabditis spiculigera]